MYNVNLNLMPQQKKQYTLNFELLNGGLNIYDLDYRLNANESPDMKNLRWKDGALGCRRGQKYLIEPTEGSVGFSSYEDLFWDCVFVHVDDEIRCYDPAAQTPEYKVLHSSVPENHGTFFRYGEYLLYKNNGGYYRIKYSTTGQTAVDHFSCEAMNEQSGSDAFKAHIPITLINTDPATGAGDLYQPENRLSGSKIVWYNAASGVTQYRLPVVADSVSEVIVDGTTLTPGTDYTYSAGIVTFTTAPPVTTPPRNNTVSITYVKANTDAYNAVMNCPYATVYGGDQNLCVVVGGCAAQPNAYFWSGNDQYSMNPCYFPMEHYNLAGDTESAVTGFGKQQGFLVVFSQKGIGKASFGTVTTSSDRLQIEMPYTAINSRIGCDYPWSIQLVENNLVFCNREHGACILLDSSAAYENNIVSLSTKVNGTARRVGLLNCMETAGQNGVYSVVIDDEYWVVADKNAYVWDFRLSDYRKPSWFLYTNIQGVAFTSHVTDLYHLDAEGGATVFDDNFSDYGEAIEKVYQFATQMMGSYDRLKDVVSAIIAVRSDTDTVTDIVYITDYERRYDLTPIRSFSWRLVPRNLAYRYLGVPQFAVVNRRMPMCRHVRHFALRLENNTVGSDLSVISAQIFYNFQGRQR